MTEKASRRHDHWRTLARAMALVALGVLAGNIRATAQDFNGRKDRGFQPGNLVVSRSVYDNNASNVTVGEPLPPNCVAASGGCGGMAGYNGLFPYVFNNDNDDSSFGITSRIFSTRSRRSVGGSVPSRCRTACNAESRLRATNWLPASARNPSWPCTSPPTADTSPLWAT